MTQQEALSILKTGANCFLTGEPGSGKSHTINTYIRYLHEHGVYPAVTASTGIAATHIGGTTIHAWAGIGIARDLDAWALDRITQNEKTVKRIKTTRVLIIDEISMLSGTTLAMVELVARTIHGSDEPFGGMQVVFVGDFFQLPPIVNRDDTHGTRSNHDIEWDDEEKAAQGQFAFQHPVWKKTNPLVLYINEQHRTEDADFLDLLLSIRRGTFTESHKKRLRTRYVKEAATHTTQLYTHNADVDRINAQALQSLEGKEFVYEMSSIGRGSLVETLTRGCLSPETLKLKKNARVMFTKNDQKGQYVNGTLGTVVSCDTASVSVKTDGGKTLEVVPEEWKIDDGGKVLAKIEQLPLRLAWAITIHKSQGMSLDSAHMDLSKVFEYGQGYVALSRLKTLAGLSIAGFSPRASEVHPTVRDHDALFHDRSTITERTFSGMPQEELQKMQQRFIVAVGGTIEKKALKTAASAEQSDYQIKLAQLREKFPNAYKPWEMNDDSLLRTLFEKNLKTKEISTRLGRQPGSIRARLVKLGLVEDTFGEDPIAVLE